MTGPEGEPIEQPIRILLADDHTLLREGLRRSLEGAGLAVVGEARDGEEEVLKLIADGASTPEVGTALYISTKTVRHHLSSIYEKLDSRDRTQAVLRAVRMGIIRLD